ncbi:BZ3500_MvSof-1268-A1-R1_Chr1-1g01089 [Microbotryum saponariae]|uniref:BZ3500_MvSof-1268-A1-R1_Chr1-1g01089 protein n=1 Tax=Microbotryum saponariae TaxID=289078 RepID=A0A2X0KCU8_9BASI|nr:BZ3500_MvSof-1268-A1-R1_Chr1-1g01089 [Microbotryum saponariae]SCZ93374.1 BZ3501_MvSof-1269-A2-R1_Chr1-1g00686 [Microbotryum saponariae]
MIHIHLPALLLLGGLFAFVGASSGSASNEPVQQVRFLREQAYGPMYMAVNQGLELRPNGILKDDLGRLATLLGDGHCLNHGLNKYRRCPLTFKCDGSGQDGYLYDINGYPVPFFFPASWRYFGPDVGWQPPARFSCKANWVLPSQWLDSAHLATWWTSGPPAAWKAPPGFACPSFWTCSACERTSSSAHIGLDPQEYRVRMTPSLKG